MNKVYIIAFDLDNTIYRESEYLKNVTDEFLALTNLRPFKKITEDNLEAYLNRRKKDILGQILEIFIGLKKDAHNYKYFHNLFFKIYHSSRKQISLYKDFIKIKEFILTHRSNFIINLITNGIEKVQRNKVSLLNIETFFDEIYISTGGNLNPKDAILKKIKVKYPDCYGYIYVGDDPQNDVVPANKNSFLTYRVKRGFFVNENCNEATWDEPSMGKLLKILRSGMWRYYK